MSEDGCARGFLVAVVLGVVVLVAAAAPAVAQDTVTPAGPATVRGNWLGPHTAEGLPPQVLIGWTVTVGPGSNAGPVRLRVLRWGDRGTVVGSGPVEQLPATRGTYAFALPTGVRYDYRSTGLALEQEVGEHAIIRTHPPDPRPDGLDDYHALDVFRPPLAGDAAHVAFSERRRGQELLVRGTIEHDIDQDLLGDVTQDVGDLRLLDATILARERVSVSPGRETNRVLIAARVLNAGFTVRHYPHITEGVAGSGSCDRWQDLGGTQVCADDRSLAPGAEAELRVWSYLYGRPEPTRVEVASEGPDLTPEDNAGPIRLAPGPGSAASPAERASGPGSRPARPRHCEPDGDRHAHRQSGGDANPPNAALRRAQHADGQVDPGRAPRSSAPDGSTPAARPAARHRHRHDGQRPHRDPHHTALNAATRAAGVVGSGTHSCGPCAP